MNNAEKTKKELESSNSSVEKIYDGELISVVKHVISRQNTYENSDRQIYECVVHPQAVTMVPLTNDGKLILVRQYRYCIDEILLEFPAGNISPNEDPFVAANRELQEEIGYKAETLILLESIFSSPGFSDEYLHIFLAKDLTPSQFIAEDTFEIDVVTLTLDEMYRKIKNHEIIDAKTLCGVLLFDKWKKENQLQ
ncbi:MAG: NUDIX hydrolase [Chlamydiales bacterium]